MQQNESLENDKNKLEAEVQQALKKFQDYELSLQRHEINYGVLT
jgi:multidrug resistance efflux pump